MSAPAQRIKFDAASRYELLVRVAAGGMATVYVARERGDERLIAVKRAHAHLVEDPDQRRRLLREAKLASLIQHPNVVSVREIEELESEVLLVMDYVEGASLAELLAAGESKGVALPPSVAVRILLDACAGLDAAHVAEDEEGRALGLVHRDISPQNILVGLDGVARVVDFGIAKESEVTASTTTGVLKGKFAYMAPEYVSGQSSDARADVFSLGVVLWEALANDRLFRGANDADTLRRVVEAFVPPLRFTHAHLASFDPVLEGALQRSPSSRFRSAGAFAAALSEAAERAGLVASADEVGAYVHQMFGDQLERRRTRVTERSAEIVEEHTAAEAKTLGDDLTTPMARPEGADETATRRRPAPPAQHRTFRMDELEALGVTPPPSAFVPRAPEKRTRWPRAAIAVGALAMAGFGGCVALAIVQQAGDRDLVHVGVTVNHVAADPPPASATSPIAAPEPSPAQASAPPREEAPSESTSKPTKAKTAGGSRARSSPATKRAPSAAPVATPAPLPGNPYR